MIILDATSVRAEMQESDAYTDENVSAVAAISDDVINMVISEMADDDFWYAYDALRQRVIQALLPDEDSSDRDA